MVFVGLPRGAAFAGPLASTAPLSCFSALAQLNGARLSCEHLAWMTDDEREEVQRLTRGYLRDARCKVSVDIDATTVKEALAASDRVVDFPAQPVTCELDTSVGPMTVGGTFAPHVEFKNGAAISASPGLANITGISRALAWPVVAYINNARSITSQMAAMINAFRGSYRLRQARS